MRRGTVVVLVLLASAPAWADYKDSFRKGMEALDRGRWADVARYMQEAIADNPKEGERLKLYGLRFEVYLPHFYLGAAQLNLGNCAVAVKEFETSRSQGAIRNHSRYPELLDGLKSCEGQGQAAKATTPPPTAPTAPPTTVKTPSGPDPAALAQAAQSAETALSQADGSARAVAALSGDALLAPVWTREPALGRAESEAKESLAAARAKLEAGRRGSDLGLMGEAREQAGRARDKLDAVRQAAERRRESLRAEQVSTRATPTPPPVAPGERKTPEDLLAGAQAYFDGRYQDSVRLLERVTGGKGRAAAQAWLLRAAARFALFKRGGEKDADLRRLAAEDVVECRRADPSLSPDAAAFSPPFVEFFRSSR
jgi:tetratricopeptide (TPR) repeat protein